MSDHGQGKSGLWLGVMDCETTLHNNWATWNRKKRKDFVIARLYYTWQPIKPYKWVIYLSPEPPNPHLKLAYGQHGAMVSVQNHTTLL